MGRYVPPELEGTTSFNKASGKGHALGARARKLKSEGILTVRFELPFPIWCTTCKPDAIIGQGVRFNAEKKKVGNYLSTPIWSFRFKHTVCGGWIEVRTDPKETQYVVTEGAKQRDTGENRLADGEIRIGVSEEDKERLEREGGFGALEKRVEDKKALLNEKDRIESLYKRSGKDWEDPYERSRALRKSFRVERKARKEGEERTEALKEKLSLGIDLVEEREEDGLRASLVDFGDMNFKSIPSGSMFETRPPGVVSLKSSIDQGKRGKAHVAFHDATNKRAKLQRDLNGRTRDVMDPFLAGRSAWTSGSREKIFGAATTTKKALKSSPRNSKPGEKAHTDKSVRSTLVNYDSD